MAWIPHIPFDILCITIWVIQTTWTSCPLCTWGPL